MADKYSVGSIWRKWDLHVHTPASVLNNGFGIDWDVYVQRLFKALITKNIAAVGLTDYFVVDGYKKIKEEFLSNQEKLESLFLPEEIQRLQEILILPNIEFRSNIFVGDRSINFHVIFSEQVSIRDIEERFLHEIDFTYESEPQTPERKRKLKIVNLEELGARLKREHVAFQDKTDLHVGMMNAVVDHEQVSKILADKESIFGGKYLFVVDPNEDLSAIPWDSRGHLTRKILIQKSDVLFTSNERTRLWGLGKPPYQEGDVEFIKEFKTLKPCVHGSDAHRFDHIGHPCALRGDGSHSCSDNPADCGLRYCWIKADTTFEGLRQILYEPEARVLIQEADPTPNKTEQTIQEFNIEASSVDTELNFNTTKVFLNEGLVAVTGGKGGGKTAFVDLIANSYEDRSTCDDKNSFVRRVGENPFAGALKTNIFLKGGKSHSKEISDKSFIDGASIVYVAQGELEKHVEDPSRLEAHINSLIFDSNEIKDSALLYEYQSIDDDILDLNERIGSLNNVICQLEDATAFKVEEDLKKEASKIATDLNDVAKKISDAAKILNPEKIRESETKQKQLAKLRDKKVYLNEFGILLRDAIKFLDEDLVGFNTKISQINILAGKLGFAEKFSLLEASNRDVLVACFSKVKEEMRKVVGEIEKFQKDLDEKERGIKEHATLLDKKKELERLVQGVKSKQDVVLEQKTRLQQVIKDRKASFKALISKKIEQRGKYLGIITTFAANKSAILSDLEFTADLIFDFGRFVNVIEDLVDLRKVRIKASDGAPSEIAFFMDAMKSLVSNPSADNVAAIIDIHLDSLLSKILGSKKGSEIVTKASVYKVVFSSYLSVIPSVKYKRVNLAKLSLGQKATVLMKIYLAQGENPIIIDSHDDHLDNEFIMQELVQALREAKQRRQIIIVSNNGNVVVNSDAEQVVLASRSNAGEISYVSGSLENPSLRSKLLLVLEGGEDAFNKRQHKYRLI